MNYSLGTIGAGQILEDPPNSYDDYKETDVALDPFYHDVPKLKRSRRRKRDVDVLEGSKHSDIIKNDQDAVNVLKFLFDWYRNEKTNPTKLTTPPSAPLVSDEILKINEELSSPKPKATKIEISGGTMEEDPLDVRFKTSDLFNKKSKYSIVGDDKYSVTHEEVKKVNHVQQNLSFSDTKVSPKYSYLDDYVDDNYEPDTYKSKYTFEDPIDDHDRFRYHSSIEDEEEDEDVFSKNKDVIGNRGSFYQGEEANNYTTPDDYVDDNIEPIYYKERYDTEEKPEAIEEKEAYQKTNKPKDMNEKEKEEQFKENENNDEPNTQVEQNKVLSQAHLESIEVDEIVESSTPETDKIDNEIVGTEQTTLLTSTTKEYHGTIKTYDDILTETPHLVTTEYIVNEPTSIENSTTVYIEEPTEITSTVTATTSSKAVDEEKPKNLESNSVSQQIPTTNTTEIHRSEPEVNVVISKAVKTNKTRVRTNSGRGRRKFKDPEANSKNVLMEKLIEKPYRAKDDYDYLKTVSNVQSSTSTHNDSIDNNETYSHIDHESVVSPNDLLLPPNTTTEKQKSTRKRGRRRYNTIESTSHRSIRRRRPSLNHIHSETHVKFTESINNNNETSKEPLSEILVSTTTPVATVMERKMDGVAYPYNSHTENSTVLPLVDTTQTTPMIHIYDKIENNLGTTNHPSTEPTFKIEEKSSNLAPVTSSYSSTNPQIDNIVAIYATSFVPTEKVHITKKKELKVYEELATTTDTDESTTIWKPSEKTVYDEQLTTTTEIKNTESVVHNYNYELTVPTDLSTTKDHFKPTIRNYHSTNILETSSDDTTTMDLTTSDNTHISKSDDTETTKSYWVTENLEQFIEEVESTTRSVAAPEKERDTTLRSNEMNQETTEITTKGSKDEEKTTTEQLTTIIQEHSTNHQNELHQIEQETSTTTEEPTTVTTEYTTMLQTQSTEPSTTTTSTTQRTRGSRIRTRPTRRRSSYHTEKNNYRHRFSTDAFTRRPQNRKQTIEEEIINTITRKSKYLPTEPTPREKNAKETATDISLRKSAVPTQSEKLGDHSGVRGGITKKTTVRKYYFFNCFNKETDKFYPDPRDCRLFHYCTQGYTKNQLLDLKFVCDFNTFFDDENLVCTKNKPKRCL